MGHVGAAHAVGAARTRDRLLDAAQVVGTGRGAAFADALGDLKQSGFHGVGMAGQAPCL
jgi:hypothetical protein